MNDSAKVAYAKARGKVHAYKARRPHRSFRMTRRRDYHRELIMPGYRALTGEVWSMLWQQRRIFLLLVLVYAVLTALLVGVGSQDAFNTLQQTLKNTSGDTFNSALGQLGKASLLFASTATGSLSQGLTQDQQVYAAIMLLLTWLTTVWLLRNILAGHKVRLRDGLYNAGAPILPTFLVGLVLIVQMLPLALAFFAYNAASQTGLLSGGVATMLFWCAASLLALLSLYWSVGTFVAFVIVALPGMYPLRALSAAGDLVTGRRLRILLRLLWLAIITVLGWAVIMIPVILLTEWLGDWWHWVTTVPVVPIVLLALSSLTVVWCASYVYILYRKVVASDAR